MKTRKMKNFFKRVFFTLLAIMVFFQPLISNAASLVDLTGNITLADAAKVSLNPLAPNDSNSEAAGMLNKMQTPKVTVLFDRAPISGQQITATASQTGFDVSGKKDLYYTWYIKHKNDTGDSSSDREKWKREAAQIAARGTFESSDVKSAAYNGSNISDKGYVATPKWDTGSNDNCYMQSYTTGRLYEMTSSKYRFNCPTGYIAKCAKTKDFAESTYQTNVPLEYPAEPSCTFKDPAYCNFDQSDPLDERSCRHVPDVVNKSVTACIEAPGNNGDPYCETIDNQNFSTKAVCRDSGYNPMCISVMTFKDTATQKDICTKFGRDTRSVPCDNPELDENKPILYNSQTPPYPMLDGSGNTILDTPLKCVKYRGDNLCKHLFSELQDNGKLGDGIYDMQDEQFWGTNPTIKSTAGNGQVDEANLIGLNMDKFTWTYQDGDQIGVAVEGATADPSKHDDSSFVVTWAFSKNSCKEFDNYLNNIHQEDRQFYTEQNKTDSSATSNAFGVLVADFDINRCLKENFIDPASGGQEQLKVVLNYSPENPKNINSKNSLGSTVLVNSVVENSQGSTLDYSYSWKIETSDDGSANPPIWTDVTKNFTLNSQTDGIGNDSFSFKMDANTKDVFKGADKNATFIRVSAKVQESGGSGRSGIGKVVIHITNTDKNIEVYRTKISNDGKIDILNNPSGLICGDNTEKPCSSPVKVVQNEIIGLKFSDEVDVQQIVWTKDGEDLLCTDKISNQCDSSNIYQVVPVSGVVGSTMEISAKVKNASETVSQEYTRNFIVVEPSVNIISGDKNTAWEKIVGYEKDLDGKMITLSSPDVLKAFFGSKVLLKANFVPSFIEDPTYVKYQWVLNGETKDNDNNPELAFSPSEDEGAVYSVNINAAYSQPAEKRKALQDFWGISAFDSQDTQISASIQIEAEKEDIPLEVSVARNFLASLIGNISTQTLFMMKVLLSGGLFFAVTFVIFSVIPNTQYPEKRRI